MTRVNFQTSDFRRQVADSADLFLRNRYFEKNPSLNDDGASMLARPGMRQLVSLGTGPIRGMDSEAGSFGGDLFVASGQEVYRVKNDLTNTSIYSNLQNSPRGVVRMAITAVIGTIPAYCFIADGTVLLVYLENGFAHSDLTGTAANNDVVRIDTVYYKFTNGSVNAGTPAGTAANPWLVNIGVTAIDAFTNLASAINGNGIAGTDYSSALTAHTTVIATNWTSTLMTVRSTLVGALGNAIITTTTGVALSWTAGGTLAGGGLPGISQVQMPDNMGVIDVAVINSYVIVIPVQTNGYQGRFYWIKPGETVVDPLDFATAERSPDAVYGVRVFGDQFWLPGESTTEVWYVSGGSATDPTAPVMQRLQGIVLDRGSWQNTAVALHETMVIVDADGGVFRTGGSSPDRVSTPDIEEQIRLAMAAQSASILT